MFRQTRCRNSAGIQSCKSYFTSLSGRAHYGFSPWVKTLALHTRVFMFIHRTSAWCSFFGCVKLAAIFGRAAPVGLRPTHRCFICQLWQIRRLLRSSLAAENAGFEPFRDVLVFSGLSGLITVYIISAHELPPILIICQAVNTDWNIIILPRSGQLFPCISGSVCWTLSPSAGRKQSAIIPFPQIFCCSFCWPRGLESSLIERKRRVHASVVPHHSENKPF